MTKFFNDQGSMKKLVERLNAAKATMPPSIREAHTHCSKHRVELLKSESCGCFYCGKMFRASEITDWVDGGQTALCPKCGIDSVIGSAAGLAITKEFLDEMHERWF
jgi:hypothetical protein